MFMFVQTSDDMKVDDTAHTLRLVNVAQQTIYFSDRPVRLAGHLTMSDYLKEWAKAEAVFRVGPECVFPALCLTFGDKPSHDAK